MPTSQVLGGELG